MKRTGKNPREGTILAKYNFAKLTGNYRLPWRGPKYGLTVNDYLTELVLMLDLLDDFIAGQYLPKHTKEAFHTHINTIGTYATYLVRMLPAWHVRALVNKPAFPVSRLSKQLLLKLRHEMPENIILQELEKLFITVNEHKWPNEPGTWVGQWKDENGEYEYDIRVWELDDVKRANEEWRESITKYVRIK